MTAQSIVGSGVELAANGIRIGGQPTVLLCASLFYFRLPRQQWAARLAQVRASGYRCIDVYVPWNFHETAPGRWMFAGRRDVGAFLDLAHDAGLYVIARPGPYICSEWDGGGLPAWLGLDPQLRVRQNEPRFLAAVSRWFDHVLPLLAERQYPAGGPVIMVQLDNELDFFDCADRSGYIAALRDQALDHGITVPLIACAGQGDLAGATGEVPGVVPACNFYPDDASPHVEAEVQQYRRLLAARDLPLLVTETNRRHRTLRRLLASGASLIAPYLQCSGWNFGFTPSTGNWGAPGSLMSHDYDFGGYISSTGAERAEFEDARLLARVVETLGPKLARATAGTPRVHIETDFPTSDVVAVLDLDGGGQLLALPNLGTTAGTAVLSSPALARVPVAIPADASSLLLLDLPLQTWGAGHRLTLASADLIAVAYDRGRLALAFSSAVPVTVQLDEFDPIVVPCGVAPQRTVAAGTGTEVTLVVLSPSDAARLATLGADGSVGLCTAPAPAPLKPTVKVGTVRRRLDIAPARPAGNGHDLPPTLESLGVYRGRGTYRTTVDVSGVDELLLVGAADLVDLSIAGQTLPTIARFGATERIDVREVQGYAETHADVEIWGHSNFDDARLPALRLGGLRGLGSLWIVEGVQDVSACWTVDGVQQWAGVPAPIRTLGGWSSTRIGMPITYTRLLDTEPHRVRALHLADLVAPVQVVVDGGGPVTLHPENPWHLLPARAGKVSLTMPHHPGAVPVRAELFGLRPVTGWSCIVQDEDMLTDFASDVSTPGEQLELPLSMTAGDEAWLDIDLPASDAGWLVRPDGTQLRVTGWVGRECIGRMWLGDTQRPPFSGGEADVLWIPGTWATAGQRLNLLLRATAGPNKPILNGLRLQPPRA